MNNATMKMMFAQRKEETAAAALAIKKSKKLR